MLRDDAGNGGEVTRGAADFYNVVLFFGDRSANIVGMSGKNVITNSLVTTNAHNNGWLGTALATLSSLTVTGSSFNDLNDASGPNATLFVAAGTANVSAAECPATSL